MMIARQVECIADVGSCWGGSIETAKRCIRDLAGVGVSRVKFQLCPATNGNKPIPAKLLKDLVQCGENHKSPVSCSVWDQAGYDAVLEAGATWIKFAHSSYDKCGNLIEQAISQKQFERVYITKPLMSPKQYDSKKLRWLWTHEVNGVPVYPVTAVVSHGGMYGDLYDGYSCHCLSPVGLVGPFKCYASVVEFHANPLGVSGVPDAMFAYSLDQVGAICK